MAQVQLTGTAALRWMRGCSPSACSRRTSTLLCGESSTRRTGRWLAIWRPRRARSGSRAVPDQVSCRCTRAAGFRRDGSCLLGLGPRARSEAWTRSGFEPLRVAAGTAARAAAKAGASSLAIAFPAALDQAASARAAVEGALLGAYRFDRYKSQKDGRAARLASVR